MGLSKRVGATALASLLAIASVANAQGFYYQDLSKSCDKTTLNYQYLGCAPATSAPFFFSPGKWDPSSTADNSKDYINFDSGDFVNQTTTPYFCAQTCRAHGFKYTALYDKSCNCGNSLTYTRMGVTTTLTPDASSDNICLTDANGGTYPNCGGDLRENCGSNRGARIFVDPSFPDERTTDAATIANDYGVLGCFQGPNFPSSDSTVTSVNGITDAATCLSYCAGLGMPLSYMIADSGKYV
ncbi:hypothetical protein F5Y19DRAFT_159460 [Xylariaceae sp. FL1651]|nr:hypothetical protein F5Y19DRAFT_159460 [Xylariaceae sp. FL1651]